MQQDKKNNNMIDKGNFKEVLLENTEGAMLLPGDIYVKDIELSDEEVNSIMEEMSHYLFKHKHHYSYTNWEHSECDEENNNVVTCHLNELDEHYEPIYLVKDKQFYGLCVVTADKHRATFLTNGESYGKTESHHNESFGHVDEDDDDYYSMIKE